MPLSSELVKNSISIFSKKNGARKCPIHRLKQSCISAAKRLSIKKGASFGKK
jgi:hypothetical protein